MAVQRIEHNEKKGSRSGSHQVQELGQLRGFQEEGRRIICARQLVVLAPAVFWTSLSLPQNQLLSEALVEDGRCACGQGAWVLGLIAPQAAP